jgi:hypothetical protein
MVSVLPLYAVAAENLTKPAALIRGPKPSLLGTLVPKGLNGTKNAQEGTTHHFLTGVKVGAVFVFGVELDYILKHKGRKLLYIAAAGQTSIVINTINGGGGFFLTRWGLGVGCRYNHVIRLYDENISVGIPGYSPEVVWYKEMGLNRNWYINLRAATIITKEDFWPDISFGIFLPLNR